MWGKGETLHNFSFEKHPVKTNWTLVFSYTFLILHTSCETQSGDLMLFAADKL